MPQEIRFLRKYLGLSSKDFASKIGVDHTTVSKWERVDETQGMGPVAERFLRMFFLYEKPVDEYPLEEMGAEAAAPAHPTMVHDQRGWHPRAASLRSSLTGSISSRAVRPSWRRPWHKKPAATPPLKQTALGTSPDLARLIGASAESTIGASRCISDAANRAGPIYPSTRSVCAPVEVASDTLG